MRTALNFQPRIISLQTNIVVLLGIFLMLNFIFDFSVSVNVLSIFIFGLLYGYNIWLNSRSYFHRLNIYIIYKLIHMLTLIVVGFRVDTSLMPVFFLFASLVFFELMITYPHQNITKKRYIIVAIIIIMLLTVLFTTNDLELNLSTVFIGATLALFMYSYFALYHESRLEVLGRLSIQTELFKEAAKTNDELRLSQHKFKQIHDEMAKQKYDLEVANKKLNKMTAEIYTQNELLRYISSVLDIKELIDLVTDAILGTIGVDTCSLVLFDERNEEYLYSVKSNYPGEHKRQLKLDVKNGYLQKYFESDKIHLNNRVIRSDYLFIGERPVGSIAVIPLLRDGLTYGFLIAEHAAVDMFTENNIQFFRGIAIQITIAINNANIYALMEEMAVKDGLTGVYNRKYLQDHIDEYIEQADMKGSAVTIALFDIDRFKSVNDKYGHLFGDEAIKMAAFKTQRIAKDNDGLAVRYGGEEFVLLLPHRTMEESMALVEELHKNIKEEALEHPSGNVNINVSIGVSCYPDVATSGEDLLLRADNAMYYSKEHGRGRITKDHKQLEKVV